MDLLGLSTPAIGVINPRVSLQIQFSTGNTQTDDGTQVPAYAPAVTMLGEVQPLTGRDLKQLEGLNIQGSMRAIYIEGPLFGILRVDNKGGDLITDPAGKVWLVTQVLERWPDWTKVSVTLQNGS